jgi:hypothetical protein
VNGALRGTTTDDWRAGVRDRSCRTWDEQGGSPPSPALSDAVPRDQESRAISLEISSPPTNSLYPLTAGALPGASRAGHGSLRRCHAPRSFHHFPGVRRSWAFLIMPRAGARGTRDSGRQILNALSCTRPVTLWHPPAGQSPKRQRGSPSQPEAPARQSKPEAPARQSVQARSASEAVEARSASEGVFAVRSASEAVRPSPKRQRGSRSPKRQRGSPSPKRQRGTVEARRASEGHPSPTRQRGSASGLDPSPKRQRGRPSKPEAPARPSLQARSASEAVRPSPKRQRGILRSPQRQRGRDPPSLALRAWTAGGCHSVTGAVDQ